MLQQLHPNDTVGVVLFNTSTTVLIPSTKFGTLNKSAINKTIDEIQPGKCSNLIDVSRSGV